MIIRPARPADRDVVYEICLRTGLAGADATATYADPELLGHVYAGPYLALAPDLAFVLVGPDDQPVGYVLGAADTEAFEAACEARWWPPLRARYPLTSAVDGTPDASLVHRLHEPARADPAVLVEHPAHLHIDLLPVAQGGGHGRRLIEHLLHAFIDKRNRADLNAVHSGGSGLTGRKGTQWGVTRQRKGGCECPHLRTFFYELPP